MSESMREDRCELEPVTCWPLIYGALGVVAATGLIVLAIGFLVATRRPTVEVAATTAPRVTEEPPAKIVDRGPDVDPSIPQVAPPRAKAKRTVIREYVPLPPVKKVEEPEETAIAKETKTEKARASKDNTPRKPKAMTESALLESLALASRELDLDSEKDASKALFEASKKHFISARENKKPKEETESSIPIKQLLAKRTDLAGLPLLAGKACETDEKQAKVLGTSSVIFRQLSRSRSRETEKRREGKLTGTESQIVEQMSFSLKKQKEDKHLLVSPYEQMVQTEGDLVRKEMVRVFGEIKGKEATLAIARRAVFDLSESVRTAAIEALKKRSLEDARPILLSAFRHPWAPAADHAATALVALEDEKALPSLSELVRSENPLMPTEDKEGNYTRPTLVRVNHLRNCLLCHAPSLGDKSELVTGPVPTPGVALPVVYYESRRRNNTDLFVRADVVYFRQDFSLMHPVAKSGPWPVIQRFDYLVQQRPISKNEARSLVAMLKTEETFPQRESARWAVTALMEGQSRREIQARKKE